jgi:NifU-like protein involved in Fe-S cluster formation
VGGAVIGCTRAQIDTALTELKAMLKSDGPTPSAPFDGLEVLRPARDYKNRPRLDPAGAGGDIRSDGPG